MGFLMGGTAACPLVDGAESCPSVGWAFGWVWLEVAMCLGGLKAACLLMGGAVFPPSLLFGLGLLSPDGWGQIFPKWQPPGKLTLMIIRWLLLDFLLQCPAPTANHSCPPAFPGDPPRPTGRSDQDRYGASALPWDPVHMKPCVHPPRVELLHTPYGPPR